MPDITWSSFASLLNKFGIDLSEEMVSLFFKYHKLLLSERQKLSLFSWRDCERLIAYHFVDSALATKLLPYNVVVADLGSGAGFPGVPIKILRPDLKVYLIESKYKKAVFLEKVILNLKLNDIWVVNKRIEEINDLKFNIVISRLVSDIKETIPKVYKTLLPDFQIILYKKTLGIERELEAAKKTLEKYGIKVKEIKKFRLKHLKMVRTMLVLDSLLTT